MFEIAVENVHENKNALKIKHASKAQLEPKWSQKVSKSLQNGIKSHQKRYPKMRVDSFL